MAGHFQAIGVEDFQTFIDQAVQLGHWHARQDGGDTIVWRDESGASLVVWVSAANEIVYASPSFDARSRIPVANAGVHENQECRFDSPVFVEVLEEGEMLFPLVTNLENIEELLDREISGETGLLALSGFGEEIRAWDDEAAYYEDPTPESPDYASRSFVPSGMFGTRPHASALLTGTVESAAILRNGLTGGSFVHAQVATYGMTIDCLFSTDDVPDGLSPGDVVQGTFWLVGRLLPSA